jgi:hypothetical protein
MSVVVECYERALKTGDGESAKRYESLLWNYVNFERQNQQKPTLSGLGEPKFNVDGSPYMVSLSVNGNLNILSDYELPTLSSLIRAFHPSLSCTVFKLDWGRPQDDVSAYYILHI